MLKFSSDGVKNRNSMINIRSKEKTPNPDRWSQDLSKITRSEKSPKVKQFRLNRSASDDANQKAFISGGMLVAK